MKKNFLFYLSLIVITAIIIWAFYKGAYNERMLKKGTLPITAVIVKINSGTGVRQTPNMEYTYKIKGKIYSGSANGINNSMKVGDSVLIEYAKLDFSVSRMIDTETKIANGNKLNYQHNKDAIKIYHDSIKEVVENPWFLCSTCDAKQRVEILSLEEFSEKKLIRKIENVQVIRFMINNYLKFELNPLKFKRKNSYKIVLKIDQKTYVRTYSDFVFESVEVYVHNNNPVRIYHLDSYKLNGMNKKYLKGTFEW